jgi:hypothetical protein
LRGEWRAEPRGHTHTQTNMHTNTHTKTTHHTHGHTHTYTHTHTKQTQSHPNTSPEPQQCRLTATASPRTGGRPQTPSTLANCRPARPSRMAASCGICTWTPARCRCPCSRLGGVFGGSERFGGRGERWHAAGRARRKRASRHLALGAGARTGPRARERAGAGHSRPLPCVPPPNIANSTA